VCWDDGEPIISGLVAIFAIIFSFAIILALRVAFWYGADGNAMKCARPDVATKRRQPTVRPPTEMRRTIDATVDFAVLFKLVELVCDAYLP
jgi:hypothetical protein